MRVFVSIFSLLLFSLPVSAQSGRRVKEPKPPAPVVEQQTKEAIPTTPAKADAPPVTAERNQDYRCTDDGTLARILDDGEAELIISSKSVDTRATITEKPKPSYTKEARRIGVQGFVILRVVLSSTCKISRVRVVKGLPAGLTESAIRSACKLRFKPAIKDGRPVSQWVSVEYVFRLANSSIFQP
ncbi:MAG: energy transducer TonB [Pyrinomonadaceae bacterium]